MSGRRRDEEENIIYIYEHDGEDIGSSNAYHDVLAGNNIPLLEHLYDPLNGSQ